MDELVVIAGYHRTSVLRALNRRPMSAGGDDISEEPHRHHCCRYGPEVMEALVPLWEASDRLRGKRLQALLPSLLESLERHGHLVLNLESGGEGEAALDQQRHDRPAARQRAKDEPEQWLAPTTESTQRGAAAQGGAHV